MTVNATLETRFMETNARIEEKYRDLELKIEQVKVAELKRWVYLALLGSAVVNAGFMTVLETSGDGEPGMCTRASDEHPPSGWQHTKTPALRKTSCRLSR
jgi:hypothetical protein